VQNPVRSEERWAMGHGAEIGEWLMSRLQRRDVRRALCDIRHARGPPCADKVIGNVCNGQFGPCTACCTRGSLQPNAANPQDSQKPLPENGLDRSHGHTHRTRLRGHTHRTRTRAGHWPSHAHQRHNERDRFSRRPCRTASRFCRPSHRLSSRRRLNQPPCPSSCRAAARA